MPESTRERRGRETEESPRRGRETEEEAPPQPLRSTRSTERGGTREGGEPVQQAGTPTPVPSGVLNVVNFATPGYQDSWQKWWGVHAQGSGEAADTALATGATAGAPGTWTPAGSQAPPTVAALIASDPVKVTASPAGNWTVGQYVATKTAGAPGEAHWNGTAWVAGRHP